MSFKKIIAAITLTVCVFSLNLTAYAEVLPNFNQVNWYDDDTYTDVNSGEWYYYYVGFAYEYGIMSGTDVGYFEPGGSITLAEAITVAARLNAVYYGNSINAGSQQGYSRYTGRIGVVNEDTKYAYPTDGYIGVAESGDYGSFANLQSDSPKTNRYIRTEGVGAGVQNSVDMSWFTPYLTYAASEGIIKPTEFSGRYSEPATRAELAHILYKAIPDCYAQINDISPIPDINTSNPYYFEILRMYESGVLTGIDEYGTFYPGSNVLRCETAAMVSRILDTDLRVQFVLNQNKPYATLYFNWQYPYNGRTFGISVNMSYYDYNYFASKPRINDYSAYAKDYADVTALNVLVESLRNMAVDNGFVSDYDIAGFTAAFVQSLEYQDDMQYKGSREYPKYPLETLFEQGGDCEDTSVLLAKMLNLMGYGAVLLVSENHMAVGVQTSGRGNLSYRGVEYYYVETTEPGWRLGEVPNDLVGENMEIVYIN